MALDLLLAFIDVPVSILAYEILVYQDSHSQNVRLKTLKNSQNKINGLQNQNKPCSIRHLSESFFDSVFKSNETIITAGKMYRTNPKITTIGKSKLPSFDNEFQALPKILEGINLEDLTVIISKTINVS